MADRVIYPEYRFCHDSGLTRLDHIDDAINPTMSKYLKKRKTTSFNF